MTTNENGAATGARLEALAAERRTAGHDPAALIRVGKPGKPEPTLSSLRNLQSQCAALETARLARFRDRTPEALTFSRSMVLGSSSRRRSVSPIDISWRGGTVPRMFPDLHRDRAASMPDPVWPDPEVYADVLAKVEAGGIVALIGKRGTGKTQMSVYLALDAELQPMYFTASDLCRWLKAWLSLSGPDEGHNRRLLAEVPMLVIDELQVRLGTEYEDKELTALIDKRYTRGLATVLIANLTTDEFAKHIGGSVISRMQETGLVVECEWASFRAGGQR